MIIVVCGASGTGKSTLAKLLADKFPDSVELIDVFSCRNDELLSSLRGECSKNLILDEFWFADQPELIQKIVNRFQAGDLALVLLTQTKHCMRDYGLTYDDEKLSYIHLDAHQSGRALLDKLQELEQLVLK